MAEIVKRNWLSIALVAAIVAFLAANVIMTLQPSQRVQAQPVEEEQVEAIELDAAAYSRLGAIREQLALTNTDLAAIGCTGEETQELLTALAEWYQENQEELDTARQVQRQARQALREAMQRIQMGPRDELLLAEVPTLKGEAASAAEAYREAVEEAITVAETALDQGQITTWTAARANQSAGAPRVLRYVTDLQAEQISGVVQAMSHTDEPEAMGEAIQAELSYGQQSEIADAAANLQTRQDEVAAAERAVLPPPAEVTE